MKFLLFYKGNYGANLRGPEMRYAALAKELNELGHRVALCGRTANKHCIPSNVSFISVANIWKLLKTLVRSDVIILHGGGPVVLLLAIFSGLIGKRVVLDSYAPQWVEMDEVLSKSKEHYSFKLLSKAYFNAARCLLGALVFNLTIVANKRQLDIYRGMMAPFTLTHDFARIHVIPFGCNEQQEWSKEKGKEKLAELANTSFAHDDFLIGWLGGTYGWFDLEGVLQELSKAIIKNNKIKMVFFGVSEERKNELLGFVDETAKSNIVFLPWVDFSHRFEYWAGFDLSLVWGGAGYENDYASRTRNFDCLTLGLPIVQNHDDEWSIRLEQSGAGVVTTKEQMSQVLFQLSNSPETVNEMRAAMSQLAPQFYWGRFAKKLTQAVDSMPMSLIRRLVGIVAFSFLLPALLVFFVFHAIAFLFSRDR